MLKRIARLMITMALLAATLLPNAVFAGDTEETPRIGEYARFQVLDKKELDDLMADFVEEMGLKDSTFGVSMMYTATGETWSWNGDTWFPGRSLYKVALNMMLANKVYNGELTQGSVIRARTVKDIEERSLIKSNNEVSEMLINYMGGFHAVRRAQAEMVGASLDDLPGNYVDDNVFSSNFMLRVIGELYENEELYPNVIDCMKQANPGEYFRAGLEDKYVIAQKYGGGDADLNCAGIIYTEHPILLSIMSTNAEHRQRSLEQCAVLMTEYAEKLDVRLEEMLKAEAVEEKSLMQKAANIVTVQGRADSEETASAEAAQTETATENTGRLSTGVEIGAVTLFVLWQFTKKGKKSEEKEDK